jgi:KAP-like P-loop domain-containing protein
MLIPDYETEVDFLNCEAISSTVVELLKDNRNRALTIGVHGDWGAGKSSVLKMIESELGQDSKVAVLWFNGWTFEGFDDAKTVLIESTITEICRLKSGDAKLKGIGRKLLKRVNWLKIAKRGSGVAYNILTGLPSVDQLENAMGTLKNFSENAQNVKADEIPGKLDEIAGFLKPAENGENIPDTIHAFREDFRSLLDEAKIDQLVVLIDDLDRCLPTTAIETLEAIRLFLFVPKTAFVIGADEAMIEYAVRQHFPDLPVASGPLPYARNYLEKLVQIPFRIPALGAQETRTYVTLLLVQSLVGEDHNGFKALLEKAKETMQKPWLSTGLSQSDIQAVDNGKREALDSAFILAQQIAPILADGTKGNPRQIKRFLNALLVRQVIAKARGFGDLINQRVLAKLMLAERFQPDFYDHIASQAMVSDYGLASDIFVIEDIRKSLISEDEKRKVTKKKTSAAKNENNDPEATKWLERNWLKRWFDIEPTMGDIDLRPYVFVARDKRLLSGASGSSGLEALVTKLSGSKLELRTAEPEVRALLPGDANIVFNGLRERILGAGNFSTPPRGIDGLSIVAKHHPSLQSEIISLLGSIDPKELGLWVIKGWNESITNVTASNELSALMQKWADQDDNRILKQGASAALAALQKGVN